MKTPNISSAALDDIAEIWEYIAVDSADHADQFVTVLHAQCELIANYPGIGRRRDEVRHGLRSWPVDNYVIFYEIRSADTVIIRIVHGALDIDSVFPI